MDATPEPSDEEEESSDEEEDGFGAKKKEVDEDPVARKQKRILNSILKSSYCRSQSYGGESHERPYSHGWES